MDTVAFHKDVLFHLRVPTAGLMTKVNASIKHLAHGNLCHDIPFIVGYCLAMRI